ncbi:MAG: hypothetical protein V4700_05245 [Pseudomonadota bacterium]
MPREDKILLETFVKQGNLEGVRSVLAKAKKNNVDVDINAQGIEGKSLLRYALENAIEKKKSAESDSIENDPIINLLLEGGADPYLPDGAGGSPVSLAMDLAEAGNIAPLKKLGASLSSRQDEGEPLNKRLKLTMCDESSGGGNRKKRAAGACELRKEENREIVLEIQDADGKIEKHIISDIKHIKDKNNYVLNPETLEIRFKAADNKEYTLIPKVDGLTTYYTIVLLDHQIDLDNIIRVAVFSDEEKQTIYDHVDNLKYPKWSIKLPDPMLANKFLVLKGTDKAADIDKGIDDKINEMYRESNLGESQYYEYQTGEEITQTRTKLDQLKDSPIFHGQIYHCLRLWQEWIDSHLPDQKAAARRVLQEFRDRLFEHLNPQFYADHRNIIYGAGKRSIEIITVALKSPSLVDFLKGRMTNLLKGELLVCADGTATNLLSIAEGVKSAGNFLPDQLAKDFIKERVVGVARNPYIEDQVLADQVLWICFHSGLAYKIGTVGKELSQEAVKIIIEREVKSIFDEIEAKKNKTPKDLAIKQVLISKNPELFQEVVRMLESKMRESEGSIQRVIATVSQRNVLKSVETILGRIVRSTINATPSSEMANENLESNDIGDIVEKFQPTVHRSVHEVIRKSSLENNKKYKEKTIPGNQIHGVNYLQNKAADHFSFSFLSREDIFQEHYDKMIYGLETIGASSLRYRDNILSKFYKFINEGITVKRFVEHVIEKLQTEMQIHEEARLNVKEEISKAKEAGLKDKEAELEEKLDDVERQLKKELENKLDQLGDDKNHNLYEIFNIDDDTGRIVTSNYNAAKLTIVERLQNSGFLGMDANSWSRLANPDSPFAWRNPEVRSDAQFLVKFRDKLSGKQYRIYPSTIELTWIDIPLLGISERHLFLDLLKKEGGVEKVKQAIPDLENIDTLNLLIQNRNDLTLCLDATGDVQWLNLLFSLPLADDSILSRILSTGETSASSSLPMDFTSFFNDIADKPGAKRIVDAYPEFIRWILGSIKQFGTIDQILFIRNLCLVKGEFKGFTGLTFGFSQDEVKIDPKNRLEDTNFNRMNLQESVFKLPMLNCEFNEADLSRAEFSSILEIIDFFKANLFDTDFSQAKITNQYFYANKEAGESYTLSEKVGDLNFENALFSTRSFTQVLQLYRNLDKTLVNLDGVEKVNFEDSGDVLRLKRVEFFGVRLEEIDFSDPTLCEVLNSFEVIEISDIELKDKLIDLGKLSGVTIRISNSNLTGSTIKNIKGELELQLYNNQLGKVTFQASDLSRVSFMKSYFSQVKLKNVQLNGYQFVQFYAGGCRDFSEVALVGEFPPEITTEVQIVDLQGAILSKEATKYLLDAGVKNFSGADLRDTGDLLEDYIGNLDYSFQDTIFPDKYAAAFEKRLQEGKPSSKQMRLDICGSGLGSRKKRAAGKGCIGKDGKDEIYVETQGSEGEVNRQILGDIDHI